jgi:hypothetical protein
MDGGTLTETRRPGTCGARTKSRTGVCRRGRGWGTDHPGYGNCRVHGGNTPDGIRFAAVEQAQAEGTHMAMGRRVEPIDALLNVVYAVAGRVEWIGRQLAAVAPDEMVEDGARGRDLHVWGRLHGLELDRLARVSKMALDAGVAERRVQMAERTGALIGAAFEDALADVAADVLPPELRLLLVRKFSARLSMLEASDDGPSALTA